MMNYFPKVKCQAHCHLNITQKTIDVKRKKTQLGKKCGNNWYFLNSYETT